MHTFSPALGKQIIEQMFGTLMICVYIGYHYILLTNNRRLLEGSTIFTPTIIKDYYRLKMHKFTVAPSLSSNGGWIVQILVKFTKDNFPAKILRNFLI